MSDLDDLTAEVADEETVADSIVTLLHGIKQQLDDALSGVKLPPGAQAKLDAAFSRMVANKQKIAQAVVDNTPHEEPGSGDTTTGGSGQDTSVGGGGTVPTGGDTSQGGSGS